MTLSVATLKGELDAFFQAPDFPVDNLGVGQKWADAVKTYSEEGTVNGQSIAFSSTDRDNFATAFSAAVVVPGSPSVAALGIQLALDVFWTANLDLTNDQAGPAVPAGSTALKNALESIFLVLSPDKDSKITAIATAIDVYTKLVAIPIDVSPSIPSVVLFNVT